MSILWAGDFNTVARSPLYSFIRDASFEHLKPFLAAAWTGQKDSIRLYQKSGMTLPNGLDELSKTFDPNIHGSVLETQTDPNFLKNLQSTLEKYTVELDGLQVKINYRNKNDQTTGLVSQKMRSAYAEDYAVRKRDDQNRVGFHGEMLASTVPIQDPYAVTVDYIL